MELWISRYGSDPRVLKWLEDNPPPANWQESPEAWAYTEMVAPGWRLR
jgi:hypothetical protein